MTGIWLVIKEAATSKKFIMAIASAIAGYTLKIGLDLPAEDVAAVLAPMVAYIFAQGWADRGKEAAKIEGTVTLATADQIRSGASQEPPQAVKDKLL